MRFTLTLAGAYWTNGATPDGGWFTESSALDALLGYTLPILASIFIASHIQRHIAGRYGLRVGHIVPVPEPSIALWSLGALPKSMLIWPFGLFLIPTRSSVPDLLDRPRSLKDAAYRHQI